MLNNNNKNRTQKALVLQGGGTLGAYEAGVVKILCKNLAEQDKENGEENTMLLILLQVHQ